MGPALALKVDHACRIDDDGIGRSGSDSAAIVLSAAIRKLGAFDLILLDPPYEYDEEGICAMLAALSGRLAVDGFLVLERRRNSGTSLVSGLMHLRRITSGDSALEFYGQAHD